MQFDISPDLKEKIYNEHLQEIVGVKFTPREIDVIACILHNRGEKKIASLLTITHRTVGVHVRNIMNKLGCNSKDYIIDAVERSGKLQYFRQYYFYLVADLSFIKTLQKIAKLINRSSIQCTIDFTNSLAEGTNKRLKQIKEHLHQANIILTDINAATGSEGINLHVFSEDTIIKKNLSQYESNKLNGRDIALVFGEYGDDLTLLGNMQYVEFLSTKNYYFSILELIRKIIGAYDIEKFIQEFKNEYQSLQSSWKGVGVAQTTAVANLKKPKIVFIVSTIIFVIVVLAGLLIINRKTPPPDISYINAELDAVIKEFSADNVSTESDLKRNYGLVRKVIKLVDNFKNQEVQKYFKSTEVSQAEVINCLYIFHALATYYTYIEHDGIKARELGMLAKEIAEYYVIHHNNIQIDFDKLSPEEIYLEFNIFKDLPEMYTKTIYILGRTYVYQGDIEDAVPYFELAKYLGNKLMIFEGHLAIRSGLEVVRRIRIEKDIKNGHYDSAQKSLLEAIKVFSELREDKNQYKMSYRPNNLQSQIIIPADNVYNRVFADDDIIKAYSNLIKISQDKKQKLEYAFKVLDKFISSNSKPGTLAEAKQVATRKAASVYNSLGNLLLLLDKEEIDFSTRSDKIAKELGLVKGNNLDVILQIFDLAKLNSRNSEHTKADSYNGSARVKERMIEKMPMSVEQKNKLQNEITELKAKRDEINTRLKRKVPLFP